MGKRIIETSIYDEGGSGTPLHGYELINPFEKSEIHTNSGNQSVESSDSSHMQTIGVYLLECYFVV